MRAERRQLFIETLRETALSRPGQTAYTFLDGASGATCLTYGDLDRQALAIAARLQRLQGTGQRALLLYSPGLDFVAAFLGCLYGGVAAVPAYPPTSERTLPRLLAIARDARPALALTTSRVLGRLQAAAGRLPELDAISWVTTDEISPDLAREWQDPRPAAETLAFLQYTSGSTASPKGVRVSHGNLLHNEEMIRRAFGQSAASVIVGWLPLYHDMGLIGNVLQPLYLGATCILMSPVDFLQRPVRWLEAISRYGATTSGGPNFAYDLCVRKIDDEQRATLDLGTWEVAFNGAEPIRHETMERFAQAFAPCGFRREAFYPCYGLAEVTLFVTGGGKDRPPVTEVVDAHALEAHRVTLAAPGSPSGRTLVGSGHAWMDQEVAIVDPESCRRCAAGEVGEIWVSGPSVAGGYWRRPEETERDFGARLASGEGPFLRTGDLGFLRGGELFVTGRLKDLIILRGRNLYPQDIELTAERSHPALRPGCSAAFAVDAGGEERLVILLEMDLRREETAEAAAAAIRRAVAEEHEAQVHEVVLIRKGSIPKTSSGKVQRHAGRGAYLAGALEVVGRSALESSVPAAGAAAADGLEPGARLLELAPQARLPVLLLNLSEQAGRAMRVDPSRLPADRPLTELGFDSLAAMELQHAVESALGVSLSLGALLAGPTLSELAADLLRRLVTGAAAGDVVATPRFAPQPVPAVFPLSHGQLALWYLDRLVPGNPAYILAGAGRVHGDLDAVALRQALQALASRHPALRTVVEVGPSGPAQRVIESLAISFLEEDAAAWSEDRLQAWLQEEAYRPFDLESGPLLRASLFHRSPGEQPILLLAAHHMAVDFWSLVVLLRDLGTLYRDGTAAVLEPLPLTVADYVRWQQSLLAGPRGEELWAYWSRQLAGRLAPLDLPTDRPRPQLQTFAGGLRGLPLEPRLTGAFQELSRSRGATLYTALLAAFAVLLHRHSGQEDLLVGSPVAGRGPAGLSGLVGYFTNPVVLRTDVSGDPAFAELLARVRRTVLAAFEHQDLPFPLLAERLAGKRDASRSPIFQAMFVLQKSHLRSMGELASVALGEVGATVELGGLTVESLALPPRGSQFDLTLEAAERDGALLAALHFNADLFDPATVDRLLRHFATLLAGIAADPSARLSELPLLTEAERRQLLVEWAETPALAAEPACIHQLFEAQTERSPEAVAVVAEERVLTYRELNRRANALAAHLRSLGVGPEVRVGICTGRSAQMVVAVLGTLKAGGVYVPLDPAYPRARLDFMGEDSGLAVLLSERPLASRLPASAARAVFLDELAEPPAMDGPFASGVDAANLAYVIYTSGSTGPPKGVAIAHRSTVARLRWAGRSFPAEELAGVLAATSICFDLSVFELFVPLSHGGSVIVAENGLQLPFLSHAPLVRLVNTVPSVAGELVRSGGLPSTVRAVNLAGEPLLRALVDRLEQHAGVRRVLNLYGPSEDTTYSTFSALGRGDSRPPSIGRPLAGTRAYLLDRSSQPVPVGVPGELYLGGAGLARGYLKRPDLTAERFVPDPFAGRPGERLYRTGDLARYRPDGEIEFLGRLDHQVKLRGFRIELGEIEEALRGHPAVRDAVAAALNGPEPLDPGDLPHEQRLVAYAVAEEGQAPSADELREFLRRKLPAHMIPSAFVLLPAFPLTESGKIDRKSLPVPSPVEPRPEETFVPPSTPVEQMLAVIWCEVLSLPRVGLHDDFFALGGQSFKAAQVLARISEAFQVELPLRSLLARPTVAGMAVSIAEEMMRQADPEMLTGVLAEVRGEKAAQA